LLAGLNTWLYVKKNVDPFEVFLPPIPCNQRSVTPLVVFQLKSTFTGVLKKVEVRLGEDKLPPQDQVEVRKMETAAAQARH